MLDVLLVLLKNLEGCLDLNANQHGEIYENMKGNGQKLRPRGGPDRSRSSDPSAQHRGTIRAQHPSHPGHDAGCTKARMAQDILVHLLFAYFFLKLF